MHLISAAIQLTTAGVGCNTANSRTFLGFPKNSKDLRFNQQTGSKDFLIPMLDLYQQECHGDIREAFMESRR